MPKLTITIEPTGNGTDNVDITVRLNGNMDKTHYETVKTTDGDIWGFDAKAALNRIVEEIKGK